MRDALVNVACFAATLASAYLAAQHVAVGALRMVIGILG